MTKEDIISMAREAGFMQHLGVIAIPNIQNLERFASLVAAAEREACAKVCDELQSIPATEPRHCAEDIRARGNT